MKTETLTPSRRSIAALLDDPYEDEALDPVYTTRALVDNAKDRGLIRAPGDVAPIKKDGIEVAKAGTVRTQWVKITPTKARTWLENNFRNRPLKEDVIESYAREMTNGTWARTHQGIAFNDADELIDGQHRLHAVMRSGKSIWMMVTFGLPKEIEGKEMTTMDAVDRGRPRSVADQLKIQHGMSKGVEIAAVCMSIAHLCNPVRTRRLSVGETLQIFRAFETPVQWVVDHRVKAHGLKQAGLLAAFAFAMVTETEDAGPQITKLYLQLTRGENLEEGMPMWLLRNFLLSDEAKLLTRGSHRGLSEVALSAILAHLQGRVLSKLDVSTDGVEHFRSLQTERVALVAALFRAPETP